MAVFDYKDYASADAAALVSLSHRLAVSPMLDSVFGVPAGQLIDGLDKLLGSGMVSGSPIQTTGLPAGWGKLAPQDLGIPESQVDSDGHIKLQSPLTGWFPGGPQLDVLAERDAAGNITGIAISFAATNSPADVIDYLQLNIGEMSRAMEPVLQAIRQFAEANGLTGKDVLVTGYSLGAGYTNVMARFADTLAGGFFADSDYVGHAAPVIFDDPGRVLNIGYENDVVHRAAGNEPDFWAALAAADPFLTNNDRAYAASTDNLVIFDGAYAASSVALAIPSILNPMSWWAHVGGMLTDALDRISASSFYKFTERDSVIVVSNLGADLRWNTWVEDKASPTSDHAGAPAFIVGTQYDDLLADGRGNDWLDGGAGNDVIRISSGLNRVDGGAGFDTLRLHERAADIRAYDLGQGRFAIETATGLTLAEGIERVQLASKGPLGLIDWTTNYAVTDRGLAYEPWALFRSSMDIRFSQAVVGNDSGQHLRGNVVFGQGGDDLIYGTRGNDLLHGGEGNDTLIGDGERDRLYGAEGDDVLIAGPGHTEMTGGHGNDQFVFNAAASGTAVIADFNHAANEADIIAISGLRDFEHVQANARQMGENLVIRTDTLAVTLNNTTLADLSESDFVFL